MTTSAIVTEALTLTPVAAEVYDLAYTARTGPCPWPKAYGGDMVAQAVAAASLSVTDNKSIHSTHSYFMRPVDIAELVRYEVELLRDGRGYSTRQVRAFQNDKPVFVSLASFAATESGENLQGGLPAGMPTLDQLPRPDDLPSAAAYLTARRDDVDSHPALNYWSQGRGFDMRHVPDPIYLEVDGAPQPQQAVWIKPFTPLAEVAGLEPATRNRAALAWACDYTILEPALRAMGTAWAQPGLVTASLDHSMWFHREVVLDDWLLYAQEVISVQNARGLCTGRFFATDGTLVATVTQEGMLRLPSQEGS